MIIFTYTQEGDYNPEVLDPPWVAWPNQPGPEARETIAAMAAQKLIRERGGLRETESELLITVYSCTDRTPRWDTGRPMQVNRILFKATR